MTTAYFTDALDMEFDATVGRRRPYDRYDVVLDRTVFYPTSGGQPFDTGALGEAHVVEVEDTDDGAFTTRRCRSRRAARARPRDWPRGSTTCSSTRTARARGVRRLIGVRTVSFHLGAETATIDPRGSDAGRNRPGGSGSQSRGVGSAARDDSLW
jgi:alanyl-tRNA synthetase